MSQFQTPDAHHLVTLIPGDGIGPEVIAAAKSVIDAACVSIEWHVVEAGEREFAKHGTPVPPDVIESLQLTRVGLKGPITTPNQGYTSPNMMIKLALNLWCNIRFARLIPGALSRFTDLDLVVIRETTEDIGRGVQQIVGVDAGIAIKFVTRAATRRLALFAMPYVLAKGYGHITIPNHATGLRTTDGLFLEEVLAVAREYPEINIDSEDLDTVAMHLVMEPQRYQVLLCQNFYGGLLAGLCSGLIGGAGMLAGVNLNEDGVSLFEAGHGSAPKYAGQDRVNPSAMILSGALLLEHLGEAEAAARVRDALSRVVREGLHLTNDQGGNAGTSEMTGAVIAALS